MHFILLMPIILISLGLMIFNIINLLNKSETKYLNRNIWLIIILLGNLIGNIAFLAIESEKNDDSD